MKKLGIWISACRLRTLPLSISGAIVGSGIAYSRGFFDGYVFAFTILTTLSFQILSNLANDYGDGVKGTDNENRIGPERALQSGKITANSMFEAIKINILIAIGLSFFLILEKTSNSSPLTIWRLILYFDKSVLKTSNDFETHHF